MSSRYNLVLSDDLNRELERVVEQAETSKSEILRKALQLYLAAREGKQAGMKLGLVDPETRSLKTEFVGL